MKKSLLIFVLCTLVLIGGTSVNAKASSWHKGSPKITRGVWTDAWKYPKYPIYDVLGITSHALSFNDDYPGMSRLHYKKVGHHKYKFRGYNRLDKKYYVTPVMYFSHKRMTFHGWGGHYHLRKRAHKNYES